MRKFLSVAALLFFTLSVRAQAGALDSTFGNGGIVKTSIGPKANTLYELAQNIFIQKDGKLLVVVNFGDRVFLTRRFPDGSLDTTYGHNGVSDLLKFENPCIAAMQDDESVVVATQSGFFYSRTPIDLKLMRITKHGALDSTFGINGSVTTDFGYENDIPASITLQPDGKIVVAGTSFHNINADGVFTLARYNTNGTPDHTFGIEGKVITEFGGRVIAASVTLTRNDKIVLAGTAYESYLGRGFAVVQYNTNGTLDDTFGQSGIIITDVDNKGGIAKKVAVDGNDHIIVAGSTFTGPFNSMFAVVRYNSNGVPDPFFNGNGVARADFGHATNTVYDMVIQPDNKIVLGGYTGDPDAFARFAVARFDTNGSLDATFNGNGKAVATFEGYNESFIYSLALSEDGKIVAGGFARTYSVQDMAFVQYDTDGTLDQSFGDSGKRTDHFKASSASSSQLMVQADGKILVGSTIFDGDSVKTLMTRYTPDGTADAPFGTEGSVVLEGHSAAINGVQSDGKIITGSYRRDYKQYTFSRYNPDGTPDLSYGENGKHTLFSDGSIMVNSAQVLENDKMVVLYNSYSTITNTSVFSLRRYTTQGMLDASFGNSGTLELDANSYLLRIQKDGKYILAGYASPSDYTQRYIRRYLPDGTIDNAYGQQGKVALDFYPYDLAFQQNGDLIVSGSAGTWPNSYTVVSKVTAAGVIDSTFRQQGKIPANGHLLTIQENDKIIVGATKENYYKYYNTTISRYDANGIADAGFGTRGMVETDIDPKGNDWPTRIYAFKNRLYVLGNSSSLDTYGFLAAYTLDDRTITFKCPADTIVSNDKGLCAAKVYGIDPIGVSAINYKLSGATQGQGAGTASGRTFNKGVTYVTYTLQSDTTQSCTFAVTVNDTEAPKLSNLTLGTAISWPVNGNLQDIAINYNALDNCGLASLTLTATNDVTGSLLDWELLDNHHIRWHPERLGLYAGSTYTITVTATDLSGIESSGSITFALPKAERSEEQTQHELQVSARPNPSHTGFSLHINANAAEGPVTVRVLNSAGIVVETRRVANSGVLSIGSQYKPGIYHIEVDQHGTKTTTKLVKLP
jgi:uncharacterized delta-60 repeat protein